MPNESLRFLRVQTRPQALAHLSRFGRLAEEEIPLREGLGRILADEVRSPENLPHFVRSTVDGYAVRARDTFGAGESTPALFELSGEVRMGSPAGTKVEPGRTVKVWTGGMLPPGADAVVMLEYARILDETGVELTKSEAPGGNTISVGEDVALDDPVLPAGRRLRPQELGLLAALGMTRIRVVKKPRVAVISTGIELVPTESTPGPAQIRDINTHTLTAQIREAGGEPLILGTVPDDPTRLRELVAKGLEEADTVLVSGGSSVGAADWTLSTFQSFEGAELLVHGVSISPGKPLIMVKVGPKSLWGLPGHAASAMISFHLFLKPLLTGHLLGAESAGLRVKARLGRNLASTRGREDWVRVGLESEEGGYVARPVLGPSGLISTLVKADGLVCIDYKIEGLEAGEEVEVHLL